jgi:hypothetical protein
MRDQRRLQAGRGEMIDALHGQPRRWKRRQRRRDCVQLRPAQQREIDRGGGGEQERKRPVTQKPSFFKKLGF